VSEKATLEELVQAARSRAFDASLIEGIEEPTFLRGLTFPQIVELARARAAAATDDNTLRRACLARARLVLGPEAPEETVDELARRTHFELLVSEDLNFRTAECREAPVEGEGVELLHDRNRAVIIAFGHTTAYASGFCALTRTIDRTFFVPNLAAPAAAAPLRLRQFWGEEYGLRYITNPDRRMDVLLALLERGEACAFAVDQPGSTKATFFGVPVRTKAGAAFLACRTGHPVVVLTTWHDDESFGVRLSRPLHARDFESPHALHGAILSVIERELDGDVSRFLGELQLAPVPAPVPVP
jgi:lauroyl/myristoyl acyltransferase